MKTSNFSDTVTRVKMRTYCHDVRRRLTTMYDHRLLYKDPFLLKLKSVPKHKKVFVGNQVGRLYCGVAA